MITQQSIHPEFRWTAQSIRAFRAYLGQSQAAFANELGIRQQTVSEWETGMYEPRGASITILNLLATSSSFNFSDLPKMERPGIRQLQRQNQTSQQFSQLQPNDLSGNLGASRQTKLTTHPDWVRPQPTLKSKIHTSPISKSGRPNPSISEIPI